MRSRRFAWWLILVLNTIWFSLWLGSAWMAPQPPEPCQPVEGVLRGAYHLHAVGHDHRDRSELLIEASREACLDFIIVTDHQGISARATQTPQKIDGLTIFDGSEWTVQNGHHHGQLVGVHTPSESVLADDASFRILNHPTWSKIKGTDDFTAEEYAQLQNRTLGIEILNGVRLWRTPPSFHIKLLALAMGPGRLDRTQVSMSLPGPDIDLWVSLQKQLQISIPMLCGSDAHGDFTQHKDSLTIWTLHVPSDPSQNPIRAIREGRLFCVNELMGSPGKLGFSLDPSSPCSLQIEAHLPTRAHWRLKLDGETISTGRSSAALPTRSGIAHLEIWKDVDLGWFGEHPRLWAISSSKLLKSCP